MNLTEVNVVAKKFNNDLIEIGRELKRVQSLKFRLKSQKGRKDYEVKMTETIKYEQLLKEARNLIDPKDKPVTLYTEEDIKILDYVQTQKAIKSIQTKKCLSKWLTTEACNNDEYRNAEAIEAMLKKHLEAIKPTEEGFVRKSDVATIIDAIKSSGSLSQDEIIKLLERLI